VSIGHAITLPWTRISSLQEVKDAGFPTVALTPAAEARSIDDMYWGERVAILLGAEGPGLSDDWLRAADTQVCIPMQRSADSLNVATAAAIAFYASRVRQARRL
jgi:tRNA G18 (ribose-2'-O)-methylase SpoU